MGHCPPPTVGLHEDPPSGRPPCLRKMAAGGLTGLWDTKLIRSAASSESRHTKALGKQYHIRVVSQISFRRFRARVGSRNPGQDGVELHQSPGPRTVREQRGPGAETTRHRSQGGMGKREKERKGCLSGRRRPGHHPHPAGARHHAMLPARAAHTRCAAHTPARVPRRPHPPAPRARTGRPHQPAPVHAAPGRPVNPPPHARSSARAAKLDGSSPSSHRASTPSPWLDLELPLLRENADILRMLHAQNVSIFETTHFSRFVLLGQRTAAFDADQVF